jgi:hypothetical protein
MSCACRRKLSTDANDHQPGFAKLREEEIEAAGIEMAAVQSSANADSEHRPSHDHRVAHVAVKLSSIVAELRRNISDSVERNDV